MNPSPQPKMARIGLPAGLLALGLGAGCAVNVNLNANRLESPETRGERTRGAVDLGMSGSNTLVAVPDPAVNPPQLGMPGWDRSGESFRPSVSFGLFERLDLILKAPVNAPALLGAKFQFLGAPQLRAQAGNFAMAVTAAAGLTEPGTSVANPVTGVNARYDLTVTSYDVALIAGWRFAETFMLYGGPFYTAVSYTGNDSLSGAATGHFPFNGSASQAGGNLGLQIDSVLGALKLEEAWALASVAGTHQAGFYTGASLSVHY